MRPTGVGKNERYWHALFGPLLEKAILPMLTCKGKYGLEHLEMIPRWIKEDGDTIMSRYLIFNKNPKDLVLYCQSKNPQTLQLGAVFPILAPELLTLDPRACREKDRAMMTAGVVSVKGPFKIDLDIKDYDEFGARLGVCSCQGSKMCVQCWDLCMHSARIIIDFVLRVVCKLRYIFHFWSGNRGLHVWCMDERAYEWTKAERTNVLNIIKRRELIEHLLPEEMKHLLWPVFDEAVTCDPSHPLGIPLAPHHGTGCIRILLPLLSSKIKFDPEYHAVRSTSQNLTMLDMQDQVDYIRQELEI